MPWRRLGAGDRGAARTWLALSVCLAVAGFYSSAEGAACIPKIDQSAAPAKPAGPGAIKVYLDGSESMSGYAAGASYDIRVQGDLINLLDQAANQRRVPIQYS